MKTLISNLIFGLSFCLFIACGSNDAEQKKQPKIGDFSKAKTETPKKTETKNESSIDLSNKGIGPIKSVTIADGIDADMAAKGKDVFGKMCTACHKMDKKFIGPKLAGVTERRAPEWIMNMIMNPEEMIAKDPIAKQLLIEANMAVMANQNINEEEARQLLEYFREYDAQ
ncbi:MAG: c-type cytochrome [Flavobacteriaceae bacterium]|nr:c-type cytochrome [Flavobacteriaceae bacterium]